MKLLSGPCPLPKLSSHESSSLRIGRHKPHREDQVMMVLRDPGQRLTNLHHLLVPDVVVKAFQNGRDAELKVDLDG